MHCALTAVEDLCGGVEACRGADDDSEVTVFEDEVGAGRRMRVARAHDGHDGRTGPGAQSGLAESVVRVRGDRQLTGRDAGDVAVLLAQVGDELRRAEQAASVFASSGERGIEAEQESGSLALETISSNRPSR